MKPIFISYSFQDQKAADTVWQHLEDDGLRCWIANRDVLPGERYSDSIVQAIEAARVVVLILSRTANGSEHVAREISIAAERRMKIVIVRVHDVKPQGGLLYFLITNVWTDWLEGSATGGLSNLRRTVRHYLAGEPIPQPERDKRRELTEKALAGDLDAQYSLGRRNADVQSGKVDLKAASEWFRKAALQGHAESAYQLARAYEKGQGVLLSQADALRWMTQAARLGDARAQTRVGLQALTDGRREKGIVEAAGWFEKAAEQGGIEALYQLSVLHLEGRGVRQNDAVALRGFRLLAKTEHSRAQYYLAWMLANGRGTVVNREEALGWTERAAENGHEKARELARELRGLLKESRVGA